jgi:hypothetical protein
LALSFVLLADAFWVRSRAFLIEAETAQSRELSSLSAIDGDVFGGIGLASSDPEQLNLNLIPICR